MSVRLSPKRTCRPERLVTQMATVFGSRPSQVARLGMGPRGPDVIDKNDALPRQDLGRFRL
jgi:hypothetical protein